MSQAAVLSRSRPRVGPDNHAPSPAAKGPAIAYQLLGPLRVQAGDHVLALGGPKQRLVLAHLLLRANQLVTTDRLIDEVWGEEPPLSARGTLHSYVSHLRKAIGPERLVGQPPGYILYASDQEIDAVRFESLARQARGRLGSDPAAAARRLREALQLWRGEPLVDLAGELSLEPEIERLSEMRLAVYEDLFDAELSVGSGTEVLPELERQVAAHPLRERLCGQLMLALYRAGRQAEALAAYHHLRDALDAELGLDPSPAIESLQHRILTQDPSLELKGASLRGYRLLEQIGSGAYSAVHRASEPQTGHQVAIRVLGPEVANERDFVQRFESDARRVSRIEHPNVVPLLDWWREPDAAYLVMRLMHGDTLADRLALLVSPADALTWAEQIGSALATAHRLGAVHGDIKPQNVLLDEHGGACLSDFTTGYDAVRLVLSGRPASADYLAPERSAGGPPSASADIFAFGSLLRELLAAAGADAGDSDPSGALVRAGATVPTDRPTSPGDLVEVARQILLASSIDPPGGDSSGPSLRNPYKGLRPFEEADAPDFVGREDVVSGLVGRLSEDEAGSNLLIVVGASGSGKSSVVNAGLIPAIRAGAVPGSERWLVAAMMPGQRPFEELERSLLSVAINDPVSLGELLGSAAGLGTAIDRALPPAASLLLVVDQFEEIFTLADAATRTRFIDVITEIAAETRSRIHLVLTLRADFYDRALRHAGFGRLCAARTHAIPPPSPQQLERIVSEPAERVDLRLEPGLAAHIVAEMREQPGGLPLLQYALTELWERRDGAQLSLAAYEASGGIVAAVGRRAEHLVSQLDAEGVEAARQLFLRLVEPGEGGPDTARRIRRRDLEALTPGSHEMDTVTDMFERYRLLQFDRDPDTREPTIELAHEALLSAWPRLHTWIDEARGDIRSQRRLALDAKQWIHDGRDPSDLLSGTRLAHVQQWALSSGVLLGPAENEFLAASLAERERSEAVELERSTREAATERRAVSRLRLLVVVLSIGTLLAASLSLFALAEGQRAAREARFATARELAAAAVANLDVDPERSILLALAAVEETRSVDGQVLREAQNTLHEAVVNSRVVLTVPDEGGYVDWVDNGDLGSVFVTQGVEESGIVNVRDATTGEVMRSWRADDVDVNDVAFSADGSHLATTGDDGTLKLWDPGEAIELARWGEPGDREVWGPSFSPDSALLAAAWPYEGVVLVVDVETHDEVLRLSDLPVPHRTAFSPDGRWLAMALRGEHVAVVVDLATGGEVFRTVGHTWPLQDVGWSPDGRWLGTSSDDNTARIYDGATGEQRFTIFGHRDSVFDLDWSPGSQQLLTAGVDGVAKLWGISEDGPREERSFASQVLRGGVGGVAFAPSGDRIITSEYSDVAVEIWDISITGDAEWTNLPADPAGFSALAVSPDGERVYTSSGDGSISAWRVENSDHLFATNREHGIVFGVAVSADGRLVASAGEAGTHVWDAATGALRFSVDPEELASNLWTQAVAWSPTADLLATASVAGPILIVDSNGATIGILEEGPGVGVYTLEFSPDGRLLAASVKQAHGERWDPAVHHVTIWDWERGVKLTTIETSPLGLAFDHTGERLATTSVEDGYAKIWDVATGENLTTLIGHSAAVVDVAWDPDPERDRVATASNDGTVRLWDARTGAPEITLQGHDGPIWQIAFSPDGSRLFSSGRDDGTIRVWAMEIDDLIALAKSELTRGLTDSECLEFLHLSACPPVEEI